jgi:acetyl-CoA C-acetyltransferase
MMFDGLTCAFDQCAMGLSTERYNAGQISRAASRRVLRGAATNSPRRRSPLASLPRRSSRSPYPSARATRSSISRDEGVRGETTAESTGQLRGAFDKDGTITAGNASQISDGGAAVLVMSEERCAQLGLTPIGELVSYGQVAGPDTSLLTQPSHAIFRRTKKANIDVQVHRPLRDQRGLRCSGPRLGRRPRSRARTRST